MLNVSERFLDFIIAMMFEFRVQTKRAFDIINPNSAPGDEIMTEPNFSGMMSSERTSKSVIASPLSSQFYQIRSGHYGSYGERV